MDKDILLAVWEYAAEVDVKSGHAIRFALTPTERKGVWHLRAQVASVVDGRAIAIVLQCEDFYPNGQAETLSGALFALQLRLTELYDRWRGAPLGV